MGFNMYSYIQILHDAIYNFLTAAIGYLAILRRLTAQFIASYPVTFVMITLLTAFAYYSYSKFYNSKSPGSGPEIKIPDDSKARITSSSLLGGNFLDIIPGSSETFLKANDTIYDTSDSVSFVDLLGKMVFSK